MNDLKPCPHCGLKNNLAIGGGDMYQVICKWCMMSGPEEPSAEEAKEAWNSLSRNGEGQ